MTKCWAILCSLGLYGLLSGSVALGETLAESSGVHLGVKAKPIVREAPRYPSSELRRRAQGWVQLSFVVSAEGDIVDPVVEESSGSSAFEKQALRTVRNWKYEPATWDGEAVQQCETEVMMIFALDGAGTDVSDDYFKRHRRIAKFIRDGEIDKAQTRIDALRSKMNLSISESAWLWTLQTSVFAALGDKKGQLRAVRRATRSSGWVDEKLYPNLLLVRTALELEHGNYSEALETHEKLLTLDSTLPKLVAIQPHIEELKAKVAGESILTVDAQIGQNELWRYRPLRRKVAITEVNGKLGNIEFRCPWQRVVDKARVDTAWDIPEDWGDCSVFVFGEPGTTFNLMEVPEQRL